MGRLREKKEEYSSLILALVYLGARGIVALTMGSVYSLFGLRKEGITLRHAEIYLVMTTLTLIVLTFGAQIRPVLGWPLIVLGNLRILQILSVNLLTLLFEFTPTSGADPLLKRTRWHFVALAFSFFDVLLIFAFMHQFFDARMNILSQHSAHFFHYLYYSLITMATVGYGDIYPVTALGRFLACYAIFISFFLIIFFVAGIMGRFQQQT